MVAIEVGSQVLVGGRQGVVRYIGLTEFADGTWIGIELQTKHGKNDGCVQGKRYFSCEMNHGIFMRSTAANNHLEVLASTVRPPERVVTPSRKPAKPIPSLSPPPLSRDEIQIEKNPQSRRTVSRTLDGTPARSNAFRNISSRAITPALSTKKPSSRISSPERLVQSPTASVVENSAPGSGAPDGKTPVRSQEVRDTLSKSAEEQTTRSREIEELKATVRVLERKRIKDREKLLELDSVKDENQKFDALRAKLQSRVAIIQEESTNLKTSLKEAAILRGTLEKQLQELSDNVEMATIDREMKEEECEDLRNRLDEASSRYTDLESESRTAQDGTALTDESLMSGVRSVGLQQLEAENEKLRVALARSREVSNSRETGLQSEARKLQREVEELRVFQNHHDLISAQMGDAEDAIEDLRKQLDAALGAQDLAEDLTEHNLILEEKITEMKVTIDDLETLKAVGDEIESGHLDFEKLLQTDNVDLRSQLQMLQDQVINFENGERRHQLSEKRLQDTILDTQKYTK